MKRKRVDDDTPSDAFRPVLYPHEALYKAREPDVACVDHMMQAMGGGGAFDQSPLIDFRDGGAGAHTREENDDDVDDDDDGDEGDDGDGGADDENEVVVGDEEEVAGGSDEEEDNDEDDNDDDNESEDGEGEGDGDGEGGPTLLGSASKTLGYLGSLMGGVGR